MTDARLCWKCGNSGLTKQMVGCDLCDRWLHHSCAGITDTNRDPNSTWKCSRCSEEEEADNTEVQSVKSNGSHRSSASSRRTQLELSLKLLNEKHEMRLKHFAEEEAARKARMQENEEFLKKRHELLKEVAEETDGVSVRSRSSKRDSEEKVEVWLARERDKNAPPTQSILSRKDVLPTVPKPVSIPVAAEQSIAGTNMIYESVPKSTSTPLILQAHSVVVNNKHQPQQNVPDIQPGHYEAALRHQMEGLSLRNFSAVNAAYSNTAVPQQVRSQSLQNVPAVQPAYSNAAVCQQVRTSAPRNVPDVQAAYCFSGSGQRVSEIPSTVGPIASSGLPNAQSATTISNPGLQNPVPVGLPLVSSAQLPLGPSSVQIAARQVMSRDLPMFSGDPQDWLSKHNGSMWLLRC